MSSSELSTLQTRLSQIKHKVLVLSGKGGVGKSTVSCQLAFALAHRLAPLGGRVGILDIDICGPSVPKILGVEKKEIFQCSEGWVPVSVPLGGAAESDGSSAQAKSAEDNAHAALQCMSIGFLLNSPDDAVVWRGPKKHAMIKQFLEDVFWGPLDVLIIDTPPGTSDEHISVCELLNQAFVDAPSAGGSHGAVVVTTPQGVALADVRKELNFCKKLQIPVLGIVENMSGYACPCCSEVTYIFDKDGGRRLAEQFQVPFLGQVPIDPKLGESEDQGVDFLVKHPSSAASEHLRQIVDHMLQQLQIAAADDDGTTTPAAAGSESTTSAT